MYNESDSFESRKDARKGGVDQDRNRDDAIKYQCSVPHFHVVLRIVSSDDSEDDMRVHPCYRCTGGLPSNRDHPTSGVRK